VEAAHNEPWAKTRDDDVTNGLALSRNAHWAFDRGLWSVGAVSGILIQPERFKEWGPGELGLAKYRGQSLQFAQPATLRARAEYLKEHRQQWGF
jgi:putative restriction endonuclease